MGTEKDVAQGDGYTTQCADDVLLSHTFENSMVCELFPQ